VAGNEGLATEPQPSQSPDQYPAETPPYVRLTFRNKPGYSQDEIAPAVPSDTRWQCGRPCLKVAGVSASSFSGVNRPGNTADGDIHSRWAPSGAGSQWITDDLGSVQDVASVSVVWYARTSTRTAFSMETSIDGSAFSQVDAGYLSGRGTNTTLRSFVPRQARYVRLSLQVAEGGAVPSLFEVGIHGETLASEARAR
jgi:hypothetical protein